MLRLKSDDYNYVIIMSCKCEDAPDFVHLMRPTGIRQ
jgi:hypothetical protein